VFSRDTRLGIHYVLQVVTNLLVQQIGISEKQYETWVELEMVEFSVLLHCPK
jgi:hypothetical protein